MIGCITYPQPAMTDDITTPSPPNDVTSPYKTSHYYLNPSIASIIQQDYQSICQTSRENDHPKKSSCKPSIQESVGKFGTKRPKSGEPDFLSKIGPCYSLSFALPNHHAKNQNNPWSRFRENQKLLFIYLLTFWAYSSTIVENCNVQNALGSTIVHSLLLY